MDIGLILVGDELLSGKRQDRHLKQVIGMLGARGLDLSWCWVLGDDESVLRRHFTISFAGKDLVLVTGGIGATPDDRTRQAAAAAAGVPLERNAEAAAVIEQRWGDQAYPHRIRMAEFPRGAQPIPNPVNQIAGFSLADHHFVPGFPEMAWPMMEWVLDTRYRGLARSADSVEHLLLVTDTPESELIPAIEQVLKRYPQVKIASLPRSGQRGVVELGVRGDAPVAGEALRLLQSLLTEQGIRFQPA